MIATISEPDHGTSRSNFCGYNLRACEWTSDAFGMELRKAADDGKSKLDEPLEADRPDFTESPTTVGKGVVQLETGYTFTRRFRGGVHTADHSFPETLLRVGVLADWLEFRAEWNYEIERTRQGGVIETESGADDMIVRLQDRLDRAAMLLAGDWHHLGFVGSDGRRRVYDRVRFSRASIIATHGSYARTGRCLDRRRLAARRMT